MKAFDRAFDLLIGHEGGFTDFPSDSGNWTGGAPGQGQLKGTKFGISARAYPNLDIRGLTVADARAIYKRDYWDAVRGDELPPAVAYLVFDAAVNNGVRQATKWLQIAAGVASDGVMGPMTMARIRARDPGALAVEFHAQRLFAMSQLSDWTAFGRGWARRLAKLPYEAALYFPTTGT